MTEKEFLKNKQAYVEDVLHILDRRAEDEAKLIFKRYREDEGSMQYTGISDAISTEINGHYARLFQFFQTQPDLAERPLFRRVILNHLPAFIRKNAKYRIRIKKLPPKIQYAILAAEIATSIVYQGEWEVDLESRLRQYVNKRFG
jgi:glutamate dehydrogenase